MSTGYLQTRDETDIETALAAIAATPSYESALALLAEQGRASTQTALEWFARYHADRLCEVRKAITPRLEQELSDGLLDNARLAQLAISVAIQRTQERLDSNLVQDPDKVARNLADVVAKSLDKKLALEGRPTQINETRSVTEIVSQLERLGVVDAEVIEDG